MNSQKILGSQISTTQLFYGPAYYANSISGNLSTLTDQANDLQDIFRKQINNAKTSLGSNIIYRVNKIVLERDNFKTNESLNQLLQILRITRP